MSKYERKGKNKRSGNIRVIQEEYEVEKNTQRKRKGGNKIRRGEGGNG